jgi:hypothetical protein
MTLERYRKNLSSSLANHYDTRNQRLYGSRKLLFWLRHSLLAPV